MKNYEVMLEQLGGYKFLAMTGCNHLVGDEKNAILKMHIPKNMSKANRIEIKLNAMDMYDMRFYKYTSPRFNTKTGSYSNEKIVEVAKFENVFCDQLQPLFTKVTGMYTYL